MYALYNVTHGDFWRIASNFGEIVRIYDTVDSAQRGLNYIQNNYDDASDYKIVKMAAIYG